MNAITICRDAIRAAGLTRALGQVRQIQGLAIDVAGLDAAVGELCSIHPRTLASRCGSPPVILGEVVGLKPDCAILMPYGTTEGVAAGCEVRALGRRPGIVAGDALLGRVIDGFGDPLDSLPAPRTGAERPLRAAAINPMRRPPIIRMLETGIPAIDVLLTLGLGQRVGIFAGSGVGKSTLLGMITRNVNVDINVIALIGERGREVREFIDKHLGPEGLRRSVVVVGTSDQPALARIRAAYAALAIAEYFRDSGRSVLLTMDSITRLAMARREVGLSAGEPPAARGYTPSVFAELPQLCERCGTAPSGGSITALFTVLAEGDDLNEPLSDSLRAILDGHIVLSRRLAQKGRYPAIDILASVSRLMPDLISETERDLASAAVRELALLDAHRQMVDIGAYEKGSNAELDHALAIDAALQAWLGQRREGISRADALRQLSDLMRRPAETGGQA